MLENPALVLPVVRQKAILLAMPFAEVQADQLSHICKQVTGAGHPLPMQIVAFAKTLKGQIIYIDLLLQHNLDSFIRMTFLTSLLKSIALTVG